ncbi:MAG: hypothetical protein K5839_04910 [Treponemataceae bacterium]|nr:hypothetical protein [Treponemataceae bacterium]
MTTIKKKISLVVSLSVALIVIVLITLQTTYIGIQFKNAIGAESENHVQRIAAAYSLAIANKVNEYLSQVRFYSENDVVSFPVIGVDATEMAKKSIEENKLYGTVLQDAQGQASTALQLIVEYKSY